VVDTDVFLQLARKYFVDFGIGETWVTELEDRVWGIGIAIG